MRLLIDTHLLLWWLADSPLLPDKARHLIGEPSNTIFVSAVTFWEIWLKASLGKLRLPADFEERVWAGSFEKLPLTVAQTREIAHLPWHHRDPFDRMLIAQARTEALTMITADAALQAYGEGVLVVSE